MKFVSRINLPCVTAAGSVDVAKFAVLRDWKRSYTLEQVLVELRKEMANALNKKLAQPPEGSTY